MKFRAWYKPDLEQGDHIPFYSKEEDGELWFVEDTDKVSKIKYPFQTPFCDPQWVVEQWIGLTDKNGKDIYEGDILESRGYKTEVIRDDDIDQDYYWGNACGWTFDFTPKSCSPELEYPYYEIVGNIHE